MSAGGLGIRMPSKATFVAQAVPPFSTRGQVYDKDKTKKATPPPPTPRHEPLGPAAHREQRPKDTAVGMSPAPTARDEEDVPGQPPAPPQLWGSEPEPDLPAAATPAASSPPDKPSVPTAGVASQPRISREISSTPNTNTNTGTPAAAPPAMAAVAVASVPKPWEAAAANSQAQPAPPAPPAPAKPPPRRTPAASSPPASAPSPLPQPQPQAAGQVPYTQLPTDMLRLTGGSRKHLVGRVTLRTFFPAATEAVTSARAGSELVRLHRVQEDGVTVATYDVLLSYRCASSKSGTSVRLTGLAPLVADMGLQQGAYVRLAWGPPTLRAVAGPGPGPAVLDQRVVVIEQVAGVA